MRSELIYAARARWRASLVELGALMHEGIGDTVTATAKRDEAALHLLHADLLEAVGKAKDDFVAVRYSAVKSASQEDLVDIALGNKSVDDLPNVAEAKAALHAARDELRDTERRWREIDQLTGNRARWSIINHFTEPSDDELLEGSL